MSKTPCSVQVTADERGMLLCITDPAERLTSDAVQHEARDFMEEGKYLWCEPKHFFRTTQQARSAAEVEEHFDQWCQIQLPVAQVAPVAPVVQRHSVAPGREAVHDKRPAPVEPAGHGEVVMKRRKTCGPSPAVASGAAKAPVGSTHGNRGTTTPNVVITLRERWDIEMLSWCIRSDGLDPKVPLDMLDPEGYQSVPYGFTTKEVKAEDRHKGPCGRLWAQKASAQRTRGCVRRLAQHKYYHDIDQVNSTPSLIWNLCQLEGIPCRRLTTYVKKREDFFVALSKTCGLERSGAKKAMQELCYGSSLKEYSPRVRQALLPFSQEMKQIRLRLLASPRSHASKKRREEYGCAPDADTDLSFFSAVVFEHERLVTQAMMTFFQERGFTVGSIIHDGIQVERRVAGSSDDLEPQLLRDCEAFIKLKTGLEMQLAEKSMMPTEEDRQTLRNAPRKLENERDAALEVVLLQPDTIVHTSAGLAVYDPECGIFCLDQEQNLTTILPRLLASKAHRLQGTRHHYLHEVRSRRDMYTMLRSVLVLDEGWLDKSLERTRLKLCFKDGYWDFQLGTFHRGSFPELCFIQGVNAVFPQHRPEYVDKVREEVFTRPYSSTEVRDFVLIALARALAGDQMAKCGYFIIGPSNSGKGMVTRLLESALPGVVQQFDAANLCKDSSDDPAKDLGWVSSIWHQRIVVANEFNLRGRSGRMQRINGNVWKSVVSGGTDKIRCRLLYQNAAAVTPQFTPFILANDMPSFDNPGDSGTQTRTVATHMDRCAVQEPAGPHQFRADPRLRERVLQPEYQAGLVWLLLESYQMFLQQGHEQPREIKEATAERLPTDGVVAAILERFSVWDDQQRRVPAIDAVRLGWSVKTRDIYTAVREAEFQLSEANIGKQLKEHLGVYKHKTRSGQVFVGLKRLVM
jgi:hypothetical protein